MVNFGLPRRTKLQRKSFKSALLTIVLFGFLIFAIKMFGGALPDRLHGRAAVIDGDSLVLEGHRIRITGLDAPEIGQICTADGRDVACGKAAKQALNDLVRNREIDCRVEDEDRYQRLLARCFVGEEDIGEQQVSAGWAVATENYHEAEAAARIAQSGIWSMEFVDPADWREQNDTSANQKGPWSWF